MWSLIALIPSLSPPSGCSEMLMAKVVSDLANRTPGKEAVAMESFAKALRMVRLFLLKINIKTCANWTSFPFFPVFFFSCRPSSQTTPDTTAPTWWLNWELHTKRIKPHMDWVREPAACFYFSVKNTIEYLFANFLCILFNYLISTVSSTRFI